MFCNARLLKNIRVAESSMQIHFNAGILHTNLIGDLPGYGMVCYHKNGISNILYLAIVKNIHMITYDISNWNQFVVHESDGSTGIFELSFHGIYNLTIGKESVAWVNIVEDIYNQITCNYSLRVTEAIQSPVTQT